MAKQTIENNVHFASLKQRSSQVDALMVTLEIACNEMESGDIETAIAGIRSMSADIFTAIHAIKDLEVRNV
ncbi:hypothetical protein M1V68_07185 [Klebsiella pneumoniae]|uniref:hypothetical protein n=1 Tax=Enterobacter roggenkampii TaxID=1812935 RepID=UPI000F81B6D1|nr:hypothetical protein [Enterobacter roggenkampii]MDZ0105698.1 hypothetical protein [Klebsiella pneumoniae]QFQ83421.1 hypothetical protein GIX98_12160 [Enterobacter roggenkampii]